MIAALYVLDGDARTTYPLCMAKKKSQSEEKRVEVQIEPVDSSDLQELVEKIQEASAENPPEIYLVAVHPEELEAISAAEPELVVEAPPVRVTPVNVQEVAAAIAEKAPKIPAPQHYKVKRHAVFVIEGCVTQLAAGSVISAATHSIAECHAQGVPLEECEPYVHQAIN